MLLPVAYFVVISFSPKTGGRYLLPTSTIVCALGVFGVIEVAGIFRWAKVNALANLIVAGGSAFLLHAQLPLLHATMDEFRHDDRAFISLEITAASCG